MGNFKIIADHCKRAHYGTWTQDAIDECLNLMEELSHEELFALRTSRWFKGNPMKHPLYERLVELLHKEHFDKVYEELEKLSSTDLLVRFKELKANNCKKNALEILLSKYDDMSEEEQKKVKPVLVKNGLMNDDDNKQLSEQ